MGGGGEESARYWGALNDIRQLREDTYGEYLAAQDGGPGLLAGTIFLGLGAVFAAGLGLLTALGPPESWSDWLTLAVVSALPGLLLFAGVYLLVLRGRRLRKIKAYGERRPVHDGWRGVLAALAGRWDGEVGSGGIRSACLFLRGYWPDQAPQMVIAPIPGERNDRLTLTATVHGHPVLLQIIDLLEPVGDFSPPALAVFVACPLDPASATTEPGQTPAGQWLVERGLRIGWNRAGAYALHGGPADALLTVEGLEQVTETLVRLCQAAPAGVQITEPDPVTRDPSAGPQEVAEHFLRALAARDALGALAYADTLLSAGRPGELTLDEVDEVIDDLRARPIGWRPGKVGRINDDWTYRFEATLTHRPPAELSVHIIRRQGRWLVCGYSVGTERVMGVEHDS